jgi:hypothetical protein
LTPSPSRVNACHRLNCLTTNLGEHCLPRLNSRFSWCCARRDNTLAMPLHRLLRGNVSKASVIFQEVFLETSRGGATNEPLVEEPLAPGALTMEKDPCYSSLLTEEAFAIAPPPDLTIQPMKSVFSEKNLQRKETRRREKAVNLGDHTSELIAKSSPWTQRFQQMPKATKRCPLLQSSQMKGQGAATLVSTIALSPRIQIDQVWKALVLVPSHRAQVLLTI